MLFPRPLVLAALQRKAPECFIVTEGPELVDSKKESPAKVRDGERPTERSILRCLVLVNARHGRIRSANVLGAEVFVVAEGR